MLPPSFHRGEAPSPPGRTAAPFRPANSANRLAPLCARRTGAAAIYHFGALPPTRPRRAHRIPPPFVPWPRHSSDADAPPRRDDAAADGFAHVRKDDRDRPRLPLDGNGRRGRVCHDDVGSQADQLLGERSYPIDVVAPPPKVRPHVAP